MYKVLVWFQGLVRGGVLKVDNDSHYQRRKHTLQVKCWKVKGENLNVVLIVVDSLRYDRLSSSGYVQNTTPFLDSVGNEGIVATRHYTVSPWTWPTVNSLLTGLYPHNHGAVIKADLKGFNRLNFPELLPLDQPTLVDYLEECGYVAQFFSGVVTADLALKGVFRRNFFDQVKWDDLPFEVLAEKLFRFSLKHARQGFFAFLQAGDLHMPISVPISYLSTGEKGDTWKRGWKRVDYFENLPLGSFTEHQEIRQQYYDAALRYVDTQVKSLVERFKEAGLYERTIFVVTSDHGEEMLDHYELEEKLYEKYRPHLMGREHGYSLFEEMVRVPFCVFGGPIRESRRIDYLTSHVDFVPSILDWLQIKVDAAFDGVSFRDVGEIGEGRAVFLEEVAYGYEQKGVVCGDSKLIRSRGYGFELLENLQNGEIEEVKDKNNSELEHLRRKLDDFERSGGVKGEKVEVEDKIRKRLEALGYV